MTNLLPPKALEQFDKWLTAYNVNDWEKLPDFVQLAYYVKWLDEYGYFVRTIPIYRFSLNSDFLKVIEIIGFDTFVMKDDAKVYYGLFTDSEQALTAAVIKASEIINERFK